MSHSVKASCEVSICKGALKTTHPKGDLGGTGAHGVPGQHAGPSDFQFASGLRIKYIMASTQPTTGRLLDLPPPLLSHVLGLLALEEEPGSFCSALLACKGLQLAGEAVRSKRPLRVSSEKLWPCRWSRPVDKKFLAFLSRTAHTWQRAVLTVDDEHDLRLMLRSLLPGAGNSLSWLTIQFPDRDSEEGSGGQRECGIPKELAAFRSLTSLAINPELVDYIKLPDMARLSALTALRSLDISAAATPPLPPQAFNQLQQLTRLRLDIFFYSSTKPAALLGWDHLSACRELRQLHLKRAAPCLSAEQALAVWQHLEQLSIFPAHRCQDAGFWRALPQLGNLTSLDLSGCDDTLSHVLRDRVPACSRLAALSLLGSGMPGRFQLPTTLTSLHVRGEWGVDGLPSMSKLRSLTLRDCPALANSLGAGASHLAALVQLTALAMMNCGLQQLHPPWTALPAVETLNLQYNMQLSDLPQHLACLPCLRELSLASCAVRRVPKVLGGRLASRLERLDLSSNRGLIVDSEGLDILCALPALTCLRMRSSGRWQSLELVNVLLRALPVSCRLDI